jgi:biopolymer transport protein ExbD
LNLRPRRREEPEIILIPFIDVLLMLLIFFMLATTFEREAALKVDLPKASATASPEQKEPLEILINTQGRYFIGDNEVINPGVDTLKRALTEAAAGRRDLTLRIRAAGQAPHQAVVSAMDAASQIGITRVSIATIEAQAR